MLTLPAGHSEAELHLAQAVADRFESAELHVYWSPSRPFAEPSDVPAVIKGLALLGALVDAAARSLAPKRS